MILEIFFIYIGILACLSASAYLIYSGLRLAGLLLTIGFLFHAQGVLYMQFIGHPEGTGACWATVQDYYSCLPLSAKVSMHLGQVGPLLLAMGVFLAGKNNLRMANGS